MGGIGRDRMGGWGEYDVVGLCPGFQMGETV